MGEFLETVRAMPVWARIAAVAAMAAVIWFAVAGRALVFGGPTAAQSVLEGVPGSEQPAYRYLIDNQWHTDSNSAEIVFFEDGTLTHYDGNSVERHEWSLEDVQVHVASGTSVPYFTAVIVVDGDEPHVIDVGQPSGTAPTGAGRGSNAALTMSEYQGETFYRLADSTFTVRNFDATRISRVRDVQAFANALRDFCASNVPLALSATWDARTEEDWGTGELETTFTCDDSASTKVTVKFAADGTYEFSK